MTAAAPVDTRAALTALLRRPRFEILPLDGIEEQVHAHLRTDARVTITASPRKGLEATLSLSERLATAGYPVVPHLSARLVRDRPHLEEVLDRLHAAGRARAVRPRRRRRGAGRSSTARPTCSPRWASAATASTRSASPATRRATT